MSRFSNRPSSNPLPRIKVEVVQTGHEIYGDRFAIYQDDRGRRAKLIPDLTDEDGTIPLRYFVSALGSFCRDCGESGHISCTVLPAKGSLSGLSI